MMINVRIQEAGVLLQTSYYQSTKEASSSTENQFLPFNNTFRSPLLASAQNSSFNVFLSNRVCITAQSLFPKAMSPNAPVILILGAGPNVGVHMTSAFAAKGYKIALTSRSVPQKKSSDDYLHIQSDLSDPSSVAGIFRKVKEAYGLPSVVVYNGLSSLLSKQNNQERAEKRRKKNEHS